MKIKKIMLVSFLVAMITACGDNQKENKTDTKQETTSVVKVEKLSPVPDVSEQNKDVKKEPVVEKQEVKDNKVSEEQKITQVKEDKKEENKAVKEFADLLGKMISAQGEKLKKLEPSSNEYKDALIKYELLSFIQFNNELEKDFTEINEKLSQTLTEDLKTEEEYAVKYNAQILSVIEKFNKAAEKVSSEQVKKLYQDSALSSSLSKDLTNEAMKIRNFDIEKDKDKALVILENINHISADLYQTSLALLTNQVDLLKQHDNDLYEKYLKTEYEDRINELNSAYDSLLKK